MSYINTDLLISKMSKKQRHVFGSMTAKDKTKYALSFLGARTNVATSIELPEVEAAPKPLKDFQKIKETIRTQYRAREDKVPYFDAPDWIGIEIECYLPKDNFYGSSGGECDGSCRDNCECRYCDSCGNTDDDRECNCECNDSCGGNEEGYVSSVIRSIERAKIKGISVDTDGSLNDEPDDCFGIEIKILTRMSDTKNLEKLCQWLKDNDAQVNKSCGLHVHLDVKNSTKHKREKLAETFKALLPAMSKMVSPSRRDNRYCQSTVSFEKYSAVNLSTIARYGTIEVRLHNGTTDFAKIYNWISFLQKVKVYGLSCKTVLPHSSNLTMRLRDMLELDQSNYEFLKARIAKFNGDTGELIEIMGEREEVA